MQEKITFIFGTDESKNNFLQCCQMFSNIQDATMDSDKFFFRNNKTLYNDINHILTLMISGGTLSAIILSIKEILLQYLKKGETTVIIQKGDRKLEIHYDMKNGHRNAENIVNEKLIGELFFSESEGQSETE